MKLFFLNVSLIETLDAEDVPVPKPLPADVNKWAGEDEEDEIKVSS